MFFKYGRKKLKSAVIVHTETALIPLYENQPLWGEQASELHSQGFLFNHFRTPNMFPMALNTFRPPRGRVQRRAAMGQIADVDSVFLKDFSKLEAYTDEQLKKAVLILLICYQNHSMAAFLLTELVNRGKLKPEIISRYSQTVFGG